MAGSRCRRPIVVAVMILAAIVPTISAPSRLLAATPVYEVEDIGRPDKVTSLYSSGLNDDGAIVGVATTTVQRAFVHRRGKFTYLSDRNHDGFVSRINNAGLAVGSLGEPGAFIGVPVVWEDKEGRELPTLGGPTGIALAINEEGIVVGNAQIEGDDGPSHAVVWEDGKATDLGVLGGDSSLAQAINASGRIAGWSRTPDGDLGTRHAVLWVDREPTDLGTLGGDSSDAIDINDRGQVVGRSSTEPGKGPLAGDDTVHGFLWENGEMTDLGTLDGGKESAAFAINEAGAVVGRADDASGASVAVRWEDGEIVDLNTLIPPDSDLVLTRATAINESGQILCEGYTTDPLDSHIVLLTPADGA